MSAHLDMPGISIIGVAILNMGSKNDTLEDYFFGMLGEDGE